MVLKFDMELSGDNAELTSPVHQFNQPAIVTFYSRVSVSAVDHLTKLDVYLEDEHRQTSTQLVSVPAGVNALWQHWSFYIPEGLYSLRFVGSPGLTRVPYIAIDDVLIEDATSEIGQNVSGKSLS